LPADRVIDWNPGLNPVGGIPDRSTIYKTISPSRGDDTAAIQSALNSCPVNGVVKLNAGVFHLANSLEITTSNCTLRGAGPGPGNWPTGAAASGTGGTYLEKSSSTYSPAVIMGPHWGGYGNAINLTSDAVKGTKSVTLASTSGLVVGGLVVLDELTDPSISRWEGGDNEQDSGWFEEPNRPLGETLEIAAISGNTVTFTTDFPIGYQVSRSAHIRPLTNVTHKSGIEDVYIYGGTGGDGGGAVHLWNCDHCWIKHIEASNNDEPINVDYSFGTEVRDSYIHDALGGLSSNAASYGIVLSFYSSASLIENNIVIRFDKVTAMRSAGGGNVFGYNYVDDGVALNGGWAEDELEGSHMTTPHYALVEGNAGANTDSDDVWGNAVYMTYFRNHFIGQVRDFPSSGPFRAAGLTQYNWWYSFVGNVLGTPSHLNYTGYEGINPSSWDGNMWLLCYLHVESTPDGGKCLSTLLRDGNYDYVTRKVHWHGIGGTGVTNGLTPPANSTLPASLYLSVKPSFFGSSPWPWVDGSNAAKPLPGQLPAQARYLAGTPNTVQ
jgi:hypothetical protein